MLKNVSFAITLFVCGLPIAPAAVAASPTDEVPADILELSDQLLPDLTPPQPTSAGLQALPPAADSTRTPRTPAAQNVVPDKPAPPADPNDVRARLEKLARQEDQNAGDDVRELMHAAEARLATTTATAVSKVPPPPRAETAKEIQTNEPVRQHLETALRLLNEPENSQLPPAIRTHVQDALALFSRDQKTVKDGAHHD